MLSLQITGQPLGPDATYGGNCQGPYCDLYVLTNASCVLMGMFTPSVGAAHLSEFSIHLVEQSALLDSLNTSGLISSNLSNISIAQCDGLSCDTASQRWLLVNDLDPSTKMHVIGQPSNSGDVDDTFVYWLLQAFTSQGAQLCR